MNTNIIIAGCICGFVMGIIGMDKILYFLKCCLILVGGIIELIAILALQPFAIAAYCLGFAFALLRNAFKSGMRHFD